jgi:hypothetical protein
LCIISWLAWFLVACVVSKKFIKFLRKSLKEFDLNLKKKSCFKRSLKKRKKESKPFLPFGPSGPAARHPSPRAGPPLSLFFFFLALADAWAPHVGLSLSPFLSSSPLPRRSAAAAADPAAPRLFPFLSLLTKLAN